MSNMTVTHNKISFTTKVFDSLIVLPWVAALLTVAFLAFILYFAPFGVDFTDEGLYLNWISNPFIYDISFSQFGFFYHPIYMLLDQNYVLLRYVNIASTYLLSAILFAVYFRENFRSSDVSLACRILLAASFGCLGLIYFSTWLVTPSYNSLAFQGLLVTAIGVFLAKRERSLASYLGWALVGLGGWVTFMAKPSSAAVLSVLVLFYLLCSRKFEWKQASLAVFVSFSLLAITALWIDGGIRPFIDRYLDAIEMANLMGGGHTLSNFIRWDKLTFFKRKEGLIVITFIIFSVFLLASMRGARLITAFMAISFVLLGLCIIFLSPLPTIQSYLLPLKNIPLVVLPVAIIFVSFCNIGTASRNELPNHFIASFIFLLLLPYAYVVGTGNNYSVSAMRVSYFWVLAASLTLLPLYKVTLSRTLSGVSVLCVISAIIQVAIAVNAPYRQPESLFANNFTYKPNNRFPAAVLSQDYGKYIQETVETASLQGFKKGSPVLDLTGLSPGLVYFLQAESIVSAWMIGGLKGSDQLAVESVKRTECEKLINAWILYEPAGPRALSLEVLASYGATLDKDYEKIASWMTAPGASGFSYQREQQLYKPIRATQDAINACMREREPSG